MRHLRKDGGIYFPHAGFEFQIERFRQCKVIIRISKVGVPHKFTQVRIKRIKIRIIADPLIQPVNTVRMTKVMNPRFIALCDGCFRKRVPELMKPDVECGFTIIIPLLVWEESFPCRKVPLNDAVIPAKQIQHIQTDIDDTCFPAFGSPDKYLPGTKIHIIYV